jgi:hypothetical protein
MKRNICSGFNITVGYMKRYFCMHRYMHEYKRNKVGIHTFTTLPHNYHQSKSPHIRGSWSHYTDTSKPVVGYGEQNMVNVQSEFGARNLSITGPTH